MAHRFQVALGVVASRKKACNDPCCPGTKTCGAKYRDLSHVRACDCQLKFGKHDVLKLFSWNAYLIDLCFRIAVLGRCGECLADSLDGRHARHRPCERWNKIHEFHLEYRADHAIEARLQSSSVVSGLDLQRSGSAVRQSAL